MFKKLVMLALAIAGIRYLLRSGSTQEGAPAADRVTPGSAEGDSETVEQDLARSAGL